MFRYRNSRTRQVVERRHRDRRLDGLAVWELLDEPAPAPAPAPGPDPEPAEAPVEPSAAAEPAPPARGASRAAWAEHAVEVAGLDETEVAGMTKAQLVERLG